MIHSSLPVNIKVSSCNIDGNNENWRYLGPDVASTRVKNSNIGGVSDVGDSVIDCVTQQDRQKIRNREYQREYQRGYRKRKRNSTIHTKDINGSKSCSFFNNFWVTMFLAILI